MVAGTFLFQVNARRLRRPLDTVDLEETPDSCERTGALMLWLSCEGRPDVWELFSDTSYLSAILDRQELMVAAPVDLRTKRVEGLSPQALQGFWSRIKMKNPKIVVMSPTVTTKNSEQKEVMWQQYRLCLAVAEYQILDGKIFLVLGPESGKIWWLKKMQYLLKKFHCRWTLLRGNHLKWILSQFWRSFTTTGVCTDLAWASGSNGMASSFCSWRLFFEGRHDYNSNATVLAMCADQSLPGSCQFEHTRGSSIGHELDQGPTWMVEASEPCIGHYDRPSCSQSTETYDFRCSVHHEQMRVIGRRETTDPSRESVGKCRSFSPHMSVLKRHFFLPNMQFECCTILQGTLGGNFDIFAASGESTAWVPCWKTRSRPVGVRVCPADQFNFFKTALDPRKWTLVVFWKEGLGRQPQLITPENEGGYNTNCPSLFNDPEVPFGPQGPQHPAPPEPHHPPGPPGLPGTPPGWPPAPSPAGGRERVETGNTSRERLHSHPRTSPPEPQLIPISMGGGEDEDDQPAQGERQRQRSRWRERVCYHVPVPLEPQVQPMVTPESDDEISDEDFTIADSSSPSAEQRNRSRRSERSRSRERVYPRSSSRGSQQQQPVVPPPQGIQQNQPAQSDDENCVGPYNRVSNHSGSPQDHEGTQRQGHKHRRREEYCRKAAENTTKGQDVEALGFRWRRWRTSEWAWNLFNF